MPRLFRPHVPLSVRCAVARRQLRERNSTFKGFGGTLTIMLEQLRTALAESFKCEVKELRLDHDPPLGARPRRRRGLGRKTYYTPDANDPDHLFYRPHGPEHEGSHLVKTNVRGDHGQHPDRVLIKKERKLSRRRETGRKASRFPQTPARVKRATDSAAKLGLPKRRWPKRQFPKRKKP